MAPHLGDAPDVPPPPYTETDMFSSSGHSPVLLAESRTLPIRHRSSSLHSNSNSVLVMDDASSVTSASEVIYTPPLTPTSSRSHSFSRDSPGSVDLLSPSHSPPPPPPPPPQQQQQQNTVPVPWYHLESASAGAYFDSRPVPESVWFAEPLLHRIPIRPDCSPDDFPYQQEWARRDVRQEDWQTFLNHLFPNHAAESNEAVIQRKLRAEGIEIDADAKSAGDVDVGERTPVEAQLDQIRSPRAVGPEALERVVREWNVGFFGPRNMTIRWDSPYVAGYRPRMPGSREQSFDNSNPETANTDAPMPDRQPNNGGGWWYGDGPGRRRNGGGRWWRSNPMNRPNPVNRADTSSRGLNIGGISVGDEGVAIGNSIVADSNGLRIGGMVMDNNGLRINGRDVFVGSRASPGSRGLSAPPAPPAPPATCFAPPMPMSPSPPVYPTEQAVHYTQLPPPPPGFPGPPPPPPLGLGLHHHDQDGGSRRPGRHHHRQRHHHHCGEEQGRGRRLFGKDGSRRPRSHSSSSSTSSSSSSTNSSFSSSQSDVLSIGSLPDHDDLEAGQLGVARSWLEQWLSHPENFVTKDNVEEAKEKLKAAKQSGAGPTVTDGPHDDAVIRQQVKTLMKQWKALKREQRRMRRQDKYQKRARRRAERKDQWQAKKEMKRARREAKREEKQAKRQAKEEKRNSHHPRGGPVPWRHWERPGPSGPGGISEPPSPYSSIIRDPSPGAGYGPGARGSRGGRAGFFTEPGGPLSTSKRSRIADDWAKRMIEAGYGFSTPDFVRSAAQPWYPGTYPRRPPKDHHV